MIAVDLLDHRQEVSDEAILRENVSHFGDEAVFEHLELEADAALMCSRSLSWNRTTFISAQSCFSGTRTVMFRVPMSDSRFSLLSYS